MVNLADRSLILKTYLSRRPFDGAIWAALYSVALFMLFFLIYQDDWLGLSQWVVATPRLVFEKHQYWRAFTSILVHASLGHFLSNSVFFCGLAFLLYGYFGSWVFPGMSLGAGVLVQLAGLATYDPDVRLVGASGVVYFMAAFWLALYVGIERRLSLPRRLVNAVAFSLVLLIPEKAELHVSYRVHALGYAAGWVLGLGYFWRHRWRLRAAEVSKDPEPLQNDLSLVVDRVRPCEMC